MFSCHLRKKVYTSEGDEETVTQPIYLRSNAEIVDFDSLLKLFYDEYVVKYINNRISEIEMRGSGFSLSQIIELEVQSCSYDPYNGATYIKLPKKLENKKAVINLQNDDEMCFKYAALSALFPAVKNAQRVSKYAPYINELNFDNMKFPVDVKDINKFEKLNPSISINI